MKPEPTEGKPPFGERAFYFVMWLTAAALVVGPIALWFVGYGSTLGAFTSGSVALLIVMRFGAGEPRDRPPDGSEPK